jgi:hypothetical protein
MEQVFEAKNSFTQQAMDPAARERHEAGINIIMPPNVFGHGTELLST